MTTPKFGELSAPERLILTPGPSSLDSRVLRALSTPLVGHMDPWFIEMIGEVQVMLRQLFQTENKVTLPLSASGSGGIEAAVVNALEPGDEAIVCINGTFSERMAIIASRVQDVTIHRVEAPLGRTVDPGDVRRAAKGKEIKFIGVCQGETSTGVVTGLDEFRKVADEVDTMLIVDAVASLGGVPLDVDRQRLDVCFSGSQKAISAPPGMAPITVSPRFEEMLRGRKTPVQSWYFDLNMVMEFWGKDRAYHHTPPVSLIFALREALRILCDEGLENGWNRHRQNQLALIAGLEALGLDLFVPNADDRLPTVTSVCIPQDKAGDGRVRRQLLEEFGIEIAGGIGSLKGKIWRIGLMGHTSQAKFVLLFLAAFEKVLLDHDFGISPGAGVAAAERVYALPESATVGSSASKLR